MANMTFGGHLLSLLIWLPIVGGFAVLALNDRVGAAKWVSLIVSDKIGRASCRERV